MGLPDSNHGQDAGKNRRSGEAEFPVAVAIPEHELLRCIGRGSYGQVWLARNAMGVYRAVKIVFRDSFENRRPFERELCGIRKFEPVSRLHEGFIDVLQVGLNDAAGYFYYIMELGDDQATGQKIDPASYVPNTLASEIARRGKLSLAECLQLGLALSHALAELQKHGLVHRDIKPGNIIFVDGVPKLADIGLVTGVDDTRSYVGTAGFIAPEGPGKPEADLYSLGMVLYEVSTGKDRHEFPFLPSEWSDSEEYPGLLELNEVILQACKENPRDRYHSAWDMHGDLVVVLNGKSVKRLKQLERRMENLKRMAGVAVVILIVAAMGFYEVFRQLRAATEQHQRQVAADVAYGNRAMEAGDLFGALPYFAEALRLDQRNQGAQRNDRLRVGSILAACPKLTRMWFEPVAVGDAEFSPDDKRVLVAQYFGTAKMYEAQNGKVCSTPFGPQYGLRSAVFSPDSAYILTTAESSEVQVWDARSLKVILSLPHPDKVYMGRFSPDGGRIVTACKDGVARVWNARTGKLELALPRQADALTFAGFSHNGRLIGTACRDGVGRVWHAQEGSAATAPLQHSTWVNWLAFSPDDTRVITTCDDHKVRVWDVATGNRIMPDLVHSEPVETAEFSPDGRFILTASFDGTVRLWRASDLEPVELNSILRHGEHVMHAAFSSDGRRIITACSDGAVRVWDLAGATMPPRAARRLYCRDGSRFIGWKSNQLEICEAVHGQAVCGPFQPGLAMEDLQLAGSGEFVLTVSLQASAERTNHLIQVWDVGTGRPIGAGLSVCPPFTGAVLSDRGQHVAVYAGNHAEIYQAQTGRAVCRPISAPGVIDSALFSSDGALFVTVCGTNVEVWSVDSGLAQYPALSLPMPVVYAGFSPKGRFLITCSADQGLTKCFAQVWDVKTGRPVGAQLWHRDGVLSAAFSPDGNNVATASEDFTAKVWDVWTGRQLGLPLRHAAQVQAVAWSPGGEWVATASIDDTARLWEPKTGDPLTPPLEHPMTVRTIKFMQDGCHLVTGDRSGNTFEWDLAIDGRPAVDIAQIAQLLSGGDFISPVSPAKGATEPLSAIWPRLSAKYPRQFTVSREELMRWYEFQAEQSESEGQWAAAAFHLQHLLRFAADKESVSKRLARANERLNKMGSVSRFP